MDLAAADIGKEPFVRSTGHVAVDESAAVAPLPWANSVHLLLLGMFISALSLDVAVGPPTEPRIFQFRLLKGMMKNRPDRGPVILSTDF